MNAEIKLISPSYDEATVLMSKLSQWALKNTKLALEVISANRATMSEFNYQKPNKKFQLVFVGHGEVDALLTSPDEGINSFKYKGEHSELFNLDDIDRMNAANIFSYACLTSTTFGERYTMKSNGYIGYIDKVPLLNNSHEDVVEIQSKPIEIALTHFYEGEDTIESLHEKLDNWYEESLKQIEKINVSGDKKPLLKLLARIQKQALVIN